MTRVLPIYAKKSFSFKALDFDEGSRKVAGYLSAFNIIDSDYDRIMPGAFSKSISEIGPKSASNRKIQHLRMHDWEKQIGKFLELEEDSYGLKFVSQLGRSTAGQDAFLDYQDGIIREHSIGFNYISDKMKPIEDGKNGFWDIYEVKLWEGSAVTFGANEYTPVTDAAKGNIPDILQKLNERAQTICKVLRNGKGSDERFLNLEAEILSLSQSYNELLSLQMQEPAKKEATQQQVQPITDKKSAFFSKLV